MMDILRIGLVYLLSAWLLTSCASFSTHEEAPQNQSLPWDKRAKTLATIENWDLNGLIAIHSMAKNDAWSAHWQWQQHKNHYTISLVGPLGSGGLTLAGTPRIVTLKTSDGKQFTASSAETLLAQQLGWHLPVANLYYWVRGLPAPTVPAAKQFDAYHHLIELRQSGWIIQYLRYTSIQQIDVPSKIYLTNPDLNVKIIINQWHLR